MSTYMELFYGDQPSYGRSSSTYYPTTIRPAGWKTTSLVFHVPLCCESCVQKIRKALSKNEEVENVDVDMMKSKVIVTGYLNPERILRRIRKVKKSATFWDASYDDGTQNPYSHTAEYDYTDPHAFDGSSRAHDYDYRSRHQYVPDEYSSRTSYYGYSRNPAPRSYYDPARSYRSSYDAYRYL
ncbi:hypothetical protein R1flu_012519 [Riccia fluitans]|uniref:HMA domain-containing protein n=1 Tax=Riccia fluitans TaxID=41844 RepID=A0ABD1ZE75_9MARC